MKAKLTKAGMLIYWCEGCGHAHSIPAERWHFDGNLEKPTIDPSVRHFYRHPQTDAEVTTCHYLLKQGVMKFCGDCEHALKGQHRPLIDIHPDYKLPD